MNQHRGGLIVTGVALIVALQLHQNVVIFASAQRAIQLDVQAEWPTYEFQHISETAEFVGEFSPNSYWGYIDKYCEHGKNISYTDDSPDKINEFLEAAVFIANQVTEGDMNDLMLTVLGLGTYAPAVRFFTKLSSPFGNPCGGKAFVVTYPGEHISCDSGATLKFTPSGPADISGTRHASWDHLFPSPIGQSQHSENLAVLYGVIGTNSFCSFHARLSSEASVVSEGKPLFRYSQRHAFPGGTVLSNTTQLQGYGVFLDIKNMEYKNVDDSNKNNAPPGGLEEDGSFIEGEELRV